ncbi:MAG: hypothetical protein P1U46_02675 [Patescibacteria group bacterium]|nr:hypothetical protein [Patescibacteria group bacterium]
MEKIYEKLVKSLNSLEINITSEKKLELLKIIKKDVETSLELIKEKKLEAIN